MSDLAVELFNRLQLIDTRGDMRTLIPILMFQWKCSFCMRSKVGKTPYLTNCDIPFLYISSNCQWLSPRAGSRGYIALPTILQLLIWIRYKLCNRYKVLGDTQFMGFQSHPFIPTRNLRTCLHCFTLWTLSLSGEFCLQGCIGYMYIDPFGHCHMNLPYFQILDRHWLWLCCSRYKSTWKRNILQGSGLFQQPYLHLLTDINPLHNSSRLLLAPHLCLFLQEAEIYIYLSGLLPCKQNFATTSVFLWARQHFLVGPRDQISLSIQRLQDILCHQLPHLTSKYGSPLFLLNVVVETPSQEFHTLDKVQQHYHCVESAGQGPLQNCCALGPHTRANCFHELAANWIYGSVRELLVYDFLYPENQVFIAR